MPIGFTTYADPFTRPADTNIYAAQDVVGTNIAVTGLSSPRRLTASPLGMS